LVHAATQLLFSKHGNPGLHHVEPGGTGWSKVHLKARPFGEPPPNKGGLVSPLVVHNQVHIEVSGYRGLDCIEELVD
jgi:hypothetical protein